MNSVIRDLRYGLRACHRSPGFTLVAVLTLAVGIGASTAIFSLVDAVLLTPLPFPDPSRLVLFMTTAPEGDYAFASQAKFNAWRTLTSTFEDIAAFDVTLLNSPVDDQFERLTVGTVSANFFALFGARTQAGRAFSESEDAPGGTKVAVISDAFWTRRFQRGTVIGRTVRLGDQSHTIVGILESTFEAAIITNRHDSGPDVYVPLQIDPASTDRTANLYVGGRVRPSVSLAEARWRVAAAAADLRLRFPTYIRPGDGATIQAYQTLLRRSDRGPLLLLTGAVSLVLLIACTNLANLLLARGVARRREIAVRAALGATRRRLAQQLLMESLLLGGVGGAAGLVVARTAIRVAVALAGPTIIRVGLTNEGAPMHLRVVIFTIATTLVAVLVFGLVPALTGSRVDLTGRMNDADSFRGSGRHLRRLGGLLTAVELAMAVVLLTDSALFIRTVANFEGLPMGFQTRGVLAVQVARDPLNHGSAALARTIRTGQEQLRAIPGVLAATVSWGLPVDAGDNSLRYVVEGQPLDGLYHGMGLWRPVAPAYFEALTIPVLRGRTFTDLDSLDAPRVVIINQAMADRWWPHGDPIGERLTLGRGIGGIWEEPSREIVGVVGNVRDAAADRDPEPTSYLPIAQLSDGVSTLMDEVTWLVKTRNLSGALRARIERTVQQASGSMSVTTARSLETIKPQAAARAALRMWLMSVFAGVALLLAAIGVYGVMSHAVRQRTREIGIRIAIGAEPRHVTRLVVLTSLRYSFLGIVAGVACAVGEGRLLTAFLFGVTPWDPMALSTVVILLSFTAVVSAWLPARSAARVDPVVALRPE